MKCADEFGDFVYVRFSQFPPLETAVELLVLGAEKLGGWMHDTFSANHSQPGCGLVGLNDGLAGGLAYPPGGCRLILAITRSRRLYVPWW